MKSLNKYKLTKRIVETQKPSTKYVIIWDTEISGFGLKITPKGRRAYFLYYRTQDGRERRPSIGVHGDVTCEQARVIAKGWHHEIAEGRDPSASRKLQRDAETFEEFAERYIREYAVGAKRPSTIQTDLTNLNQHLLPAIGQLKVASITDADVEQLYRSMKDRPGAANRTLALLRHMMNIAERPAEQIRPVNSNPCRVINRDNKFPEAQRQRYLSQAELVALGDVLAEAGSARTEMASVIVAFRLLVLTGCRLSEILTLKWTHVAFEERCLHLTESKTGAKDVYLSAPALQVLDQAKRVDGNPWVIPGAKPGKRLVNLQKPWRRIRQRATVKVWRQHGLLAPIIEECANELGREPTFNEIFREAQSREVELPKGLTDVRIHDLRHSYASIGISADLSLPIIGRLLGHTQQRTTERYSHLHEDAERAAAEKIGSIIDEALSGRSGGAEVVELAKQRK